jgi:hypothetical protein
MRSGGAGSLFVAVTLAARHAIFGWMRAAENGDFAIHFGGIERDAKHLKPRDARRTVLRRRNRAIGRAFCARLVSCRTAMVSAICYL